MHFLLFEAKAVDTPFNAAGSPVKVAMTLPLDNWTVVPEVSIPEASNAASMRSVKPSSGGQRALV